MSDSPISGYDIAIVGMAGRFPGARNVSEFWSNLRDGVESVTFFTDDELREAGERPENIRDPSYVKAQPVLRDFDRFDAGFFGLSPQDAAIMDPQHRVFLEVGWEALEDAGHTSDAFPGSIGVFATCGMNTYMMYNLVNNRRIMQSVGEWLVRHTGNDVNFLATRLSYAMSLTGPSMNVQTACSSALVAVHLACQSLLSGECDLALAGGCTIALPQRRGYFHKQGEILSPDGHCRAFDAEARGTLFGSGAGVVALRRLADAVADGDQVLAVVKGSAINNDGSLKVGYLAPSVEGQAKAVAEALAVSGVDPETIRYVEMHGTGTIVGDPIEVTALTQAWRQFTDKSGFCAIGSLKPNIGHLGEAAGVAGLIKTILALKHRQLPPSLNYTSPNPQIDFAASPFFVNADLSPWPADAGPARAAVTSLGAGGTNCHVIVEEAPAVAAGRAGRPAQALLLSARSPGALGAAAQNLAAYLREHREADLADIAYTLQVGRKPFAHRLAIACEDRDQAIAGLEAVTEPPAAPDIADHPVAFLFPGQGSQYPRMGRDLYQSEPLFREEVDACARLLKEQRDLDILPLIFSDKAEAAAQETLNQTAIAQPALFIVEYALARLWMDWGVQPRALIGHSIGEYVAACLAGVFSLADALSLVADRGSLMQQAPRGAMLALPMSAAEATEALKRSAAGDRAFARGGQRTRTFGGLGHARSGRRDRQGAFRAGRAGASIADVARFSFADDGARAGAVPRAGSADEAPGPIAPVPVQPFRHLDTPGRGDRPGILGPAPARHRAVFGRCGDTGRRGQSGAARGRARPYPRQPGTPAEDQAGGGADLAAARRRLGSGGAAEKLRRVVAAGLQARPGPLACRTAASASLAPDLPVRA